jgi:UBX domain
MVVLVEPTASEIPVAQQSPKIMYEQGATRAMHRLSFASAVVRDALTASQAVCLHLRDGAPSTALADFSAYFLVPPERPALFIIAPNGIVIVKKTGFVSARDLAACLTYASGVVKNPENVSAAATAAAAAIIATAMDSTAPAAAPASAGSMTGSSNAVETATPAPQSSDPILAIRPTDTSPSRQAPPPKPTAAPPQTATPAKNAGASKSSSNRPSKSMQLQPSVRPEESSIACRIPDSSVIRRCFKTSERFEVVRRWVSELAGLPQEQFLLGTTFPRRVYDAADDRKLLSELNELCPSALLVVTVRELPTPPSASMPVVTAAASYAASAVGSAASYVARWLPSSSSRSAASGAAEGGAAGGTRDQRPGSSGGRPASMAEMRRRDDRAANGGLSYDNGNSTQFGVGDNDTGDGGSDARR